MPRLPKDEKLLERPEFDALLAALLSCKTKKALADFLRDIATLSELHALTERLEVAKMLTKGVSYREVAAETGASTTTVTRVALWLNKGKGGYTKVLGKKK